MSILETMRSWLAECPYLDEFSGGHIDWTDSAAMDYGIMPTGSVTIRMEEDVLGGKTVYKQYNMALYARGWTVDDVGPAGELHLSGRLCRLGGGTADGRGNP